MKHLHLIALAVTLASATSLHASPPECDDAVSRYNAALGDVSTYLRRYTSCLSYSQGKDDCSTEFRRLKNSQDDIESTVSDIGSYCRD